MEYYQLRHLVTNFVLLPLLQYVRGKQWHKSMLVTHLFKESSKGIIRWSLALIITLSVCAINKVSLMFSRKYTIHVPYTTVVFVYSCSALWSVPSFSEIEGDCGFKNAQFWLLKKKQANCKDINDIYSNVKIIYWKGDNQMEKNSTHIKPKMKYFGLKQFVKGRVKFCLVY